MEQLFPTFDLPEITSDEEEDESYKQSVKWDWEKGDFVRDATGKMLICDGHEAYIDWVLKTLSTERMSCLAYDSDIGTEFEDIFSYDDSDRVESEIEKTITEALMVDPRTDYVRDFAFTRDGDQLYATFTVKSKSWEEDTGLTVLVGSGEESD